jgi:hypothetical protein
MACEDQRAIPASPEFKALRANQAGTALWVLQDPRVPKWKARRFLDPLDLRVWMAAPDRLVLSDPRENEAKEAIQVRGVRTVSPVNGVSQDLRARMERSDLQESTANPVKRVSGELREPLGPKEPRDLQEWLDRLA